MAVVVAGCARNRECRQGSAHGHISPLGMTESRAGANTHLPTNERTLFNGQLGMSNFLDANGIFFVGITVCQEFWKGDLHQLHLTGPNRRANS